MTEYAWTRQGHRARGPHSTKTAPRRTLSVKMASPKRLASGRARPFPPPELLSEDEPSGRFTPAPELIAWARTSFLEPSSPLHNEDHEHLDGANLGALWTNVPYRRKQRWVLATAEAPLPPPAAGAWARARWEQQMREWFGEVPDFLLTFYAPGCAALSDPSFCATMEHELYHCAQATDKETDAPLFNRETGLQKYAIKGHDAEEFVGVVRRWGVGASAPGVRELVEADRHAPLFAEASIRDACGTCLGRAA